MSGVAVGLSIPVDSLCSAVGTSAAGASAIGAEAGVSAVVVVTSGTAVFAGSDVSIREDENDTGTEIGTEDEPGFVGTDKEDETTDEIPRLIVDDEAGTDLVLGIGISFRSALT